jgi:hypothetical protein
MSDTPDRPFFDLVLDENGDPVEHESGTVEEILDRLRPKSSPAIPPTR